jgi:hypothetical protein
MSQELIRAIDLALADQWNPAHKIVQNIENNTSYWIHAVLHKIEGDQGNSMYWYSRAGKAECFGMEPRAELQTIRQQLSE